MIDVIETSSALTEPAVLAFWASLQFDVSAWTLHIAHAYDWELGIFAGVFMSHLGNVFTCLLGVLYKFFSSGPTKASTAGMNAGIGSSYSSLGCWRHIISFTSQVTLFVPLSFPSIFLNCPATTLWVIFAWVWELFTLLIFQLYYTGVFQLLLFLRLACVSALFDWLVAFCTLFRPNVFIDPDSLRAFLTFEFGAIGVG